VGHETAQPDDGAAGLPACAGAATFYLWQRAPDGMTGMELAKQLLGAGIVVTPGVGISDALEDGTNPGDSYVRFALVPDIDEVEEAARRI
jgi:aspartate/methionine/tyrosine aminotransferase